MIFRKMRNGKNIGTIMNPIEGNEKHKSEGSGLNAVIMKLKRKPLKKWLLVTALSITLMASSCFVTAPQSYATALPTDITGHWSEPFVTSLVGKGIITGYPDGTFKPDREVSYAEFLVLTLKALDVQPNIATSGQAWYEPIINKSVQIGIIKSTDKMADLANANLPIPRQESAYVLYNALGIKEELKYNNGYDATMEQAVYDHEKIDSNYMNAVYSMLQQGMFTGSNNNFDPSGKTTRGAAGVIIERVIDSTKRAAKNELTQGVRFKSYPLYPKVSGTEVKAEFKNSDPVLDSDQIISELAKYKDNTDCFGLGDTLYYQDLINSKWLAYGYDTIAKKTESVDISYQVVLDYMKARYNFTYLSDLNLFSQNLQKYMMDSHQSQQMIVSLSDKIRNDTLVMKSYFISDKSLLYKNNEGQRIVRGRLYFKFYNPSKSSEMEYWDGEWYCDASVNQWYYVDVEITSVLQASDRKPCISLDDSIVYLSDYIAVK